MLTLGVSTGRSLGLLLTGAVAALAVTFLAGGLESGSQKAEADPLADCILALDFNVDGLMDVQDFAAFKAAIEDQALAFDFNLDGTVDVFDVAGAVLKMTDCLQQIQPPPDPIPSSAP